MLNPKNISKITLFHKDCYRCGDDSLDPLHYFILGNGIPLNTLIAKRIELNPKWQKEARSYGLELPILKIEYKNDKEDVVITYEEFIKKLGRSKYGKKAKF